MLARSSTPGPDGQIMQCVHCATPVPDGARYCHSCGSLVSDAEGQAAATAAMDTSALTQVERMLREETGGEFTIERLLGRGGMALVFLATEVQLARKVAIKVLPPELTFGHGVERFKREAKTAAALDHPHIIPIYRIGSEGRLFWYAMKYLEGQSLEELLKQRRSLPLGETLDILRQVADALDYAHDHKVIHRDIKPANVMLDSRRRVIVTDFGIAKALTEGSLTASGSVIGTPYFMSPEQGMGKPVTGASDQYSVAVMAYRMLAGEVPFEGDSAIDILHKHCVTPPPSLSTSQPSLALHVSRAVDRALSKKPEQRYPTVSAFVDALAGEGADAVDDQATVAVPAAAITGGAAAASNRQMDRISTEVIQVRRKKENEKQKSGRGLLVAGIVAAAVMLGAGGWWMMSRGGTSGANAASENPATTTPRTPAANPSAPATQPAAAAAAPVAPTTGELDVTALPRGATVQVDDEQPASDSVFDLTDGTHVVKISATGYESSTDTVQIAAGQTSRLPFSATKIAQRPAPQRPPTRPAPTPASTRAAAVTPTPRPSTPAATGTLQILIRPWANVQLDGVLHSQQTRFQATVIAGPTHTLRFERNGFKTRDTSVTLQPGKTLQLHVIMVPETSK